jgi:hypothetical protein
VLPAFLACRADLGGFGDGICLGASLWTGPSKDACNELAEALELSGIYQPDGVFLTDEADDPLL